MLRTPNQALSGVKLELTACIATIEKFRRRTQDKILV